MAGSSDYMPHSFFMFCRGEFATKLPLPAAFFDKHSVNHDRFTLQLKTDQERTWGVKIRTIDGLLYFFDGWSVFVDDNGVREMNILVFHIAGASTFLVSIYLEDSCLKIPSPPPPPSLETLVLDDDDEGETTWRFVKKLKDYVMADQRMDIPKKFVTQTGLDKQREVQLVNEAGRRWTVGMTDRNKMAYNFSRGWTEFLAGNNLKEDDILLFEYVGDEEVVKVVVMDEEEGEEMLARAGLGGLLIFRI